jgi:prepilin-type N-terminal cleavage/methylation domain-containing protein
MAKLGANFQPVKKEQGFTLIEIVLVLAIAGLIMIIVFLAVTGAQRSRRDSQRNNDLSRIASQLEIFASNNGGCYPDTASMNGCPSTVDGWSTGANPFIASSYINGMNFADPLAGSNYSYAGIQIPSSTMPAGVMYEVGSGTTCDGTANGSTHVFTVRMGLEQGVACRDNK